MFAARHLLRLFFILLAVPAGSAWAFNVCPGWNDPLPEGQARHEVFVSPYTHHWTPDSEHEQVYAISLSRRLPGNRYCGFSVFNNSFGQPSAYAFAGKTWPGLIRAWPRMYVSASAGIIYGYVGEYKDKVPLNVGGFSPVLIPAIGYRLSDRTALEMQLLGTAAIMFGATWRY
jgi:hypothetical protein